MNKFTKININTKRLALKPLSPTDATELFGIFSDAAVMRYWNTPPWTSIKDSTDFIEKSMKTMQTDESLTLGIYTKDLPRLIGKCMLFNYARTSKRAEIGFGIGKEFWGIGYMQEAGNALIHYGFKELGLRRIEAEIDPANLSSSKVLARMGFITEGLLRERWEINGVVSDSAILGLLVGDWTARSHT